MAGRRVSTGMHLFSMYCLEQAVICAMISVQSTGREGAAAPTFVTAAVRALPSMTAGVPIEYSSALRSTSRLTVCTNRQRMYSSRPTTAKLKNSWT